LFAWATVKLLSKVVVDFPCLLPHHTVPRYSTFKKVPPLHLR
jgi:hypothetical protein